MTSIGERLRRQRVERGFDLEQVARETKISPRLLEAIEAEEFDKLPGGVFRKSFVRQYARALGLEESDIASELDQIAPPADTFPVLRGDSFETVIPALPTPSTEINRRWMMTSAGSFAGVVLVMLACAGIYSWWQNSREQAAHPVQAAKKDSAVQAPEPAGIQPAPAGVPEPKTPPEAVTPSGAPITPTLAETTTPPAYVPPPEGKFRVDFAANEPAWVSIIADGKQVYVGTLEAGQNRVIEAADRVRVRVGNAGGLAVNLNGKPVGEIGPRGQIRIVELTPTGSEVLVPPKPKPEPESEEHTEPTDVSPPPPVPPSDTAPPATPDSGDQRLQGLLISQAAVRL